MLRAGQAHVQDHRGGTDSKVWDGKGAEQDKTWSSTQRKDTHPTGSILSKTLSAWSPRVLWGMALLPEVGKGSEFGSDTVKGTWGL